jgi:hypothetical protein
LSQRKTAARQLAAYSAASWKRHSLVDAGQVLHFRRLGRRLSDCKRKRDDHPGATVQACGDGDAAAVGERDFAGACR